MTSNDQTDGQPDRPRYVDRRTAEGVQRERADGHRPTDGDPPDEDGRPSALQRLSRWLRGFGGTNRVDLCLAVAVVSAVLAGCTGAGSSTGAEVAADPDADTGQAATSEDDGGGGTAAGTREARAVCEDETDDLVVLLDGVPTEQGTGTLDRSDLVHAELRQRDGEVELTVERAERGSPPGIAARLELHLQSLEDPTVTGMVRIGFPDSPTSDFTAAVGARGGPVTEVPTTSGSLGKTRARTAIAFDDLPVAPPFAWYVVQREEIGVGDVCPNVTGFTGDGAPVQFPVGAPAATDPLPSIDVEGVSYGYRGVPDTAAVGTRLAFRNTAEEDPHELALIRLEEDAPPVDEFLRLPMTEGMAISELVGVSMALPGEEGMTTKGDLLLDQPGTYVLLCALSVDTTAAEVAEHPYGPPADAPTPDGEPHLVRGMVEVIEVG